jgi:hypothetical protein
MIHLQTIPRPPINVWSNLDRVGVSEIVSGAFLACDQDSLSGAPQEDGVAMGKTLRITPRARTS